MSDEVAKAVEKWRKAPPHVRMMAGEFVAPLLDALMALDRRVSALEEKGGE